MIASVRVPEVQPGTKTSPGQTSRLVRYEIRENEKGGGMNKGERDKYTKTMYCLRGPEACWHP